MARAPRSELESFVLGLIWQLGPCSPYDVRCHMMRSPSTQWSASAGSIYPLVQRLERQRLLSSKASSKGLRARRVYSITPSGLRALRAWIGPPIRAEAITVSHDPLRSRVRFLGALTPSQRARWVKAASEALDRLESQIAAWDEAHASLDPYASLMTVCGRADVASRRAWLAALEGVEKAPRRVPPVEQAGPGQRARSGSGKSR
ncbi:MAG: PadR family transcriptional regulator [Phycisphaeraceae bacterium]|nr:PadR family transcriptional regulator [Phycisphaeraceae bacterium]